MSLKPVDRALIEAFLDDQLRVAELENLRSRLATEPQLATELAAAVALHGGIHAATDADWDGVEMQTRLELALGPDSRACPFTAEVMERLEPPVARPARRHWRKVVLAAAPLWLAALLVLAFLIGSAGGGPTMVAAVEELGSGSMLTRQGTTRELLPNDELMAGDVLTVPTDGNLAVRLKDGSRIAISNAAELRLDGSDGNNLYLGSGRLLADVQPRKPEEPLQIRSSAATAVVVGTAFEMRADADRCELVVSEGIVDLVGSGDERLRIAAGEQAIARSGRAPIRVDAAILAAAQAPLPYPVREFRTDEITALIRFGPDAAGTANSAADPDSWIEPLRNAGVQRVLFEVWTAAGTRLWPQAAAPTASETAWFAIHGDLPARLAEACAAAGIRFGIACPVNQPRAAAWLQDYLGHGPPPCEIHLTDFSPETVGQFWQWRRLAKEISPTALVSMAAVDGVSGAADFGQPIGRFVRFGLRGTKSLLMLAEVEVSAGGANVALGKPTRQSSVGWSGTPDRAVDGNRSGRYPERTITHTDYEDEPWWEVDLERPYLLDAITVWNRTDAHVDNFRNYQVQVLDAQRRVVWQTQWDTVGKRRDTLALDGLASWQPVRQHLRLRQSRYYRRADETELIGGREIFQQAITCLPTGRSPLLVVTPGADGTLPGHEVESLMHYRARWRLAFERPLPTTLTVAASSGEVPPYSLGDGIRGIAWEAEEWTPDATLEFSLPGARAANAVLLREPLDRGTRRPLATVFYRVDEKWHKAGELPLAGDRLFSFPESAVERIRIHLNHARYAPAIEEAALLRLPN